MKKRFLSILLSLCMVLALLPVTAFAEDNEEPTETPVCTCEAACSAEAMNTDCPICGVEGATIENCGKYEAPVEEPEPEQTAIEKVQAMLDALPTVEELEAAEEATVNAAYEAAQDAYDALEALNPEDQEQITGVEKLMTLMKWFNEKTSMTGGVVYNHNNVHGIESGKTYCGDTYFTVDIPAEHLDRVSYYHKASGTYPVLTPDEDGRYKLDAGLGQIAVCVEWGNRETGRHAIDFFGITIYVNHVDIDKDHNCENCKATLSTCSGGTATCKDKAVCDYCGEPYGEIDSRNHAVTEVRNAKNATCTEDGYTGDTYCKGCETKLSSGKSVDKTGHDYESKVTKEATTTSTGTKTYTCKNCGHSYEEEIAKLPSQSTSPQTGDNSNMALWFALLFISGGALTVTGVYGKKKKYSAK